jgi:hypothetical protein
MFLQNVGSYKSHMASHPRRHFSMCKKTGKQQETKTDYSKEAFAEEKFRKAC